MKNYFFMPGNKLENLDLIKSYSPDNIIIDVEDAVKVSSREGIFKSLKDSPNLKEHYIRLPLYNLNEDLDLSFLEFLLDIGYRKFILPKISSFDEFEVIVNRITSDASLILLVESPLFFLEIKNVLNRYHDKIKAISLGSHDFMSIIGGEHSLKNLEFARQQILYYARAFNIEAIDIASMELRNEEVLKEEIVDGFEKGYDAKYLIHPWQLKIFRNMKFYSEEEYAWATNVKEKYDEVGSSSEFNPIVIDGQVIERPHLNRARKILNYYNHDTK